MQRKRLTQIMPFLIPIRIWQRTLFYKIKMFFDQNTYAKTVGEILPYEISSTKSLLINENSGYDLLYQENKVHNLKIVSKTMNMIYIYPEETFSFFYLAKNSHRYGKYKKGLVLIDNKIVPKVGGGICGLSNLLYLTFLKSPLTIIERHGHKVKSLPNASPSDLDGVDATISDGWLDLKVRNDTNNIYQVVIEFDEQYMYCRIFSNQDSDNYTVIKNNNHKYFKKNNKIYESVEVIKEIKNKKTNEIIDSQKLYDEVVMITYKLPKDIFIKEDK